MINHTMNVEKEPRNQHDHDHDHDHNHEDTYWEHFLETKEYANSSGDRGSDAYTSFSASSPDATVLRMSKLLQSPKVTYEVSSSGAFCPLTASRSSSELVVKEAFSPPCQTKKESILHSKWSYYYHLPNDKNWNLASYKPIMVDIDTLEKLIGVNETVTNNIIKNCMLFVMREGVTPMWEDSCNRNGGCFSYKVSNKVVVNVWRELTYILCGNSLTIDKNHMELVNGITISPKRGFCIVKIWLKNCSLQDPNIVVDVENLVKIGCLFKTHKAEF